jgi:ParB family chromosome partitioning protein
MGIPAHNITNISFPINTIKVNQNRRKTNPEKVSEIAKSIKEIGLLNPITVSQGYTLIAGLYRLEACKLLGYSEIEVNIMPINGLLAELAEIDENLFQICTK